MEDEEDIKKFVEEKDKNYDEYSLYELKNKINIVKKQLRYLEDLLINKKTGKNKADKIFRK